MKIVSDNHPALRAGTLDFDFANPPIDPHELAGRMITCMREANGIGLAAPQVDIPVRMFVMEIPGSAARICFNPEVTDWGMDETKASEGCLSYPDLFLQVERAGDISVQYQNGDGAIVTEDFEGLSARCFLHELDHLNGVRFTDRVSRLTLERATKRLKKLTKR